jgi:hypothetical protein
VLHLGDEHAVVRLARARVHLRHEKDSQAALDGGRC